MERLETREDILAARSQRQNKTQLLPHIAVSSLGTEHKINCIVGQEEGEEAGQQLRLFTNKLRPAPGR